MAGGRIFVVGDIHGCARELERLLDALGARSGDGICFLGDYVDRGPASRDVIDRLVDLRDEGPRCTFLKGNHEDMFLAYLGYPGRYGEAFVRNGGGTTLASYGLTNVEGAAAADRVPPRHREFLLSLDHEARFDDFFCVHAGLRPDRALDDQDDEDRFWIREEFISEPHPFDFTILFGHTPQREVFFHLPYKIGLDTGLVYGNKLSCLELRERRLFQLRRGATQVESRTLEREFAPAAP